MSHHTKPAPLPTPRYFDHQRSALVDVIPNAEGEFVQVWDRPLRAPGRRLLLTYQRTPLGPTTISSRVYFPDGPWQCVDTTGPRRTFYYRGHDDHPRYEEALPNGEWLVDDFRAGLVIQTYFTDTFAWDEPVRPSRTLGDRAVLKRQAAGLSWFLSSYQETWASDALVSSTLRLAEEYRGEELVQLRIYPPHTGA